LSFEFVTISEFSVILSVMSVLVTLFTLYDYFLCEDQSESINAFLNYIVINQNVHFR